MSKETKFQIYLNFTTSSRVTQFENLNKIKVKFKILCGQFYFKKYINMECCYLSEIDLYCLMYKALGWELILSYLRSKLNKWDLIGWLKFIIVLSVFLKIISHLSRLSIWLWSSLVGIFNKIVSLRLHFLQVLLLGRKKNWFASLKTIQKSLSISSIY